MRRQIRAPWGIGLGERDGAPRKGERHDGGGWGENMRTSAYRSVTETHGALIVGLPGDGTVRVALSLLYLTVFAEPPAGSVTTRAVG